MDSNVQDQFEMPLKREPVRSSVATETIWGQPSGGAAFTLACSVSGLEDKEIYMELGIDAGYFSNIKKGKATLQADKEREFCEIVGNRIYPEWRAYQLGCTLVELRSEVERERDELRAMLAERDREMTVIKDFMKSIGK